MQTSGFKLQGVDALIKEMKGFGPTVADKAADRAIKGTARRYLTKLRRAAPKDSGRLRKALRVRYSRKAKKAWIGLGKIRGETQIRQYYKTLEMNTARGAPLHPWMKRHFESMQRELASEIIKHTRLELYKEAGRIHARQRLKRGF